MKSDKTLDWCLAEHEETLGKRLKEDLRLRQGDADMLMHPLGDCQDDYRHTCHILADMGFHASRADAIVAEIEEMGAECDCRVMRLLQIRRRWRFRHPRNSGGSI
jgi:hypothetical protein